MTSVLKCLSLAGAFAVIALGSPALADPCEAIQDRGPAPAWLEPGAQITGQVRYVGDGDSLCVGRTPNPRDWYEIRIADFFAPELRAEGGLHAKWALERFAMGKQAVCTVQRGRNGRVISYDRVIASCRIGGVGVPDAMRRAGVQEGGNGR